MSHLNPDTIISRFREYSSPLIPIPTELQAQLNKLDDVGAVIFDVYGTLFISDTGDIGLASKAGQTMALESVLKILKFSKDRKGSAKRGIEIYEKTIEEHHESSRIQGVQFPEVDIRDIWKKVWNKLYQEGLIESKGFEEHLLDFALLFELHVNPIWPMPGLAEILVFLTNRQIKLGIISNAQFYTPFLFPAFLGKTITECGMDENLCIWSYQYLEAKPSINLYKRAAQKLTQRYHIKPAQTLYIGNDIRNDIWPASKVGFRTCLFAGDQRSLRLRKDDPALSRIQPNVIITNLSQLINVLDF